MDKLVLLDEDLNLLNEVFFEDNSLFVDSDSISFSENKNYSLPFASLGSNYSLDVFIQWKDDFLFVEPGHLFYSFLGMEQSNSFKFKLFKKTFPLLVELGCFKIMSEVNKSGLPQNCKVQYFKNDILIKSFKQDYIKSGNQVLILNNDVTEDDIRKLKEEESFANSYLPTAIVQDGRIVKVNNAYEKFTHIPAEKLLGKEFDPSFFTSIDSSYEDLVSDYYAVLNRKKASANHLISYDLKGKLDIIYFRLTFAFTYFGSKPALSFSCWDITNEVLTENRALMLGNDLKTIQGICKLAIVHWTHEEGFIWTSEIFNILEIEETDLDINTEVLNKYILEDDKHIILNVFPNFFSKEEDNINKDYSLSDGSNEVNSIIRVKTSNGNLKYLSVYVVFEISDDDIVSVVGYVQDVTGAKNYEIKLESLIKEIHHRVKNNLQIILSLLRLESRYNSTSPESMLEDTRGRISAMALLHENIYRSSDLAKINLKEYIDSLLKLLLAMYRSNVEIITDLDKDLNVDMDRAIPLGLILNELISNSLKYAFPHDESGKIIISLKSEDNLVYLRVCDNGVGLPEDVDIFNSPSLGFTIVNNLAIQINAKFHEFNYFGAGFEIVFELN